MKNVRPAIGFLAGFFMPIAVAQHANKRHCKETKRETSLNARIKGWSATLNDPMNRSKDMSGFHKPGSNNK